MRRPTLLKNFMDSQDGTRMADEAQLEIRRRTAAKAKRPRSGEPAFLLPQSYLIKRDELALTASLITNRYLFGQVYFGIQPDYFQRMPISSGVYVCPMIPTEELTQDFTIPGDIDLLIIPYENDELQMHRTVAIEIKIVRASFLKQGRSPNELGLSQATGLLSMGFPYAALAYLIVSDESPREVWRDCLVAKVIDDEGRVDLLGSEAADLMPADLIDRSYGRLIKQASYSNLGLVSAYLGATDNALMGLGRPRSTWLPSCRKASPNPKISRHLLDNIVKFFERRPSCFLDNPRFDPA